MWLFTEVGMVSVVKFRDTSNFLVRARNHATLPAVLLLTDAVRSGDFAPGKPKLTGQNLFKGDRNRKLSKKEKELFTTDLERRYKNILKRILFTPEWDYPYRIMVTPDECRSMVTGIIDVSVVNYTDFKGYLQTSLLMDENHREVYGEIYLTALRLTDQDAYLGKDKNTASNNE